MNLVGAPGAGPALPALHAVEARLAALGAGVAPAVAGLEDVLETRVLGGELLVELLDRVPHGGDLLCVHAYKVPEILLAVKGYTRSFFC